MLEFISLPVVLPLANALQKEIPIRCSRQDWDKVLGTIKTADCYRSNEDAPFHIWYNITKNHYLTDGNKRMGLACFLLYATFVNGPVVIKGNMVDLSLYIANSKPEEKDEVIARLQSEINVHSA